MQKQEEAKGMQRLIELLMKRYYGIDGILDEYRQAQIDRLGNRACLGLVTYVIVASVVVLGLIGGGVAAQPVAIGFCLANLLAVLVLTSVIKTAVNRLALNQLDVTPANYAQYVRATKRRALAEAVWYTVLFWGLQAFIDWPGSWRAVVWGPAAWKLLGLSLIEGGIAWYGVYFLRRGLIDDALNRAEKSV